MYVSAWTLIALGLLSVSGWLALILLCAGTVRERQSYRRSRLKLDTSTRELDVVRDALTARAYAKQL